MFLTKLNEVLTSKNSIKDFVSDRLNFLSLGLALLINIIHWLLLFFKISPAGDRILLHYNVIFGADLVDKSIYAYLIPSFAFGILIFNFALSYVIYKKEKLVSYFFNFSTVAVQLIFFIATLVLILINV